MKKSRYTEDPIAFALRLTGTSVGEVIRKMAITEHRKLKQLLADLSLDKAMLLDVIRSKLSSLAVGGNWSGTCKSAAQRMGFLFVRSSQRCMFF